MMLKRGAIVLALLVSCATGAVVHEVVVPARAVGNGSTYGYKTYYSHDLVDLR
jgi:hypothetical protein